MTPRRYHSPLRDDATNETRRRIIAATVELHGERGAVATSHADIAARASVSVPTVYKHFPTRASLLPHCMGKVESEAPPLDLAAILAERDTDARVARFVAAVYDRHAFFAPWMRWVDGDAAVIPELAAAMARQADGFRETVRQVVAPLLRRRGSTAVLAVVQALLGFAGWQILEREIGDRSAVRSAAIAAVLAIIRNADSTRHP